MTSIVISISNNKETKKGRDIRRIPKHEDKRFNNSDGKS
jgi:hypothetical protein